VSRASPGGNGGPHQPRPSRHRPCSPTVHGIRSPVLPPYIFNLAVVRRATRKSKRNEGGRVNRPEEKWDRGGSICDHWAVCPEQNLSRGTFRS